MLKLDPRCKLYLLLLSNFLLFFHVDLITEIIIMGLLILLFFLSGYYIKGLKFLITYLILVILDLTLVGNVKGLLLTWISLLAVSIRMLYPCIVSGTYAFTTTTISEFVCALRKMHISENIIIPCMVVIRFFPTIKEDYKQIKNAMTLRGINNGTLSIFRHPFNSLEYIVIPLLMNSNNVANDLTCSALTKGIGIKGKHTSIVNINFSYKDVVTIILTSLPLILNIKGIL